jgi:hypothetical protein
MLAMQLIKFQHWASFKHAVAGAKFLVHTHDAHIAGVPGAGAMLLAVVIVVHSAVVSVPELPAAPPAPALPAAPPPPALPAVPLPPVLVEPASGVVLLLFLLQPTLPNATTSRPHPTNDKDRFIRNPPKSPACAGSQLTAGT